MNAQSHLSMAPAANFYTENMVFDVNPYTNGINGQGPNQFDARYSNNEKVAPVANSIIGKLFSNPFSFKRNNTTHCRQTSPSATDEQKFHL